MKKVLWACTIFCVVNADALAESNTILTILATGEESGELAPCGCAVGQSGGIARRATFIKSLRQSLLRSAPVCVRRTGRHVNASEQYGDARSSNLVGPASGSIVAEVNRPRRPKGRIKGTVRRPVPNGPGGLLILSNGDVARGLDRQAEIKYQTAVLAMSAMGYAAHNVGECDLFLGLSFLQEIRQSARFPLLSANLFSADGKLLFTPYIIWRSDEQEHTKSESSDGSGSSKPVLERSEGNVHSTVAVIGILSKSFEIEVKDIEDGIVVVEPVAALAPLVNRLESECGFIVLLAHTGEKEAKDLARRFPQIDLIVSGHGAEDPHDEPLIVSGLSSNEVKDTMIVNTGRRGKNIVNIQVERKFRSSNEDREAKSHLAYQVVRLGAEYTDSPGMLKLLRSYQETLRREDLISKKRKRKTRNGDSYAGSAPCAECHAQAYKIWEKSKHAQAATTLIKKGYQFDPECVVCHTTGFLYVSGFKNYENTPHLANVGCESCHGPMGRHTIVLRKAQINDAPIWESHQEPKKSCFQCHTSERSPELSFDKSYGEIKHR